MMPPLNDALALVFILGFAMLVTTIYLYLPQSNE